jgi:hypothetical protein
MRLARVPNIAENWQAFWSRELSEERFWEELWDSR